MFTHQSLLKDSPEVEISGGVKVYVVYLVLRLQNQAVTCCESHQQHAKENENMLTKLTYRQISYTYGWVVQCFTPTIVSQT